MDEYRLEVKEWDNLTIREQVDKIAEFLAFHGFLIGCVDDDQKRQDSRREVLKQDLEKRLSFLEEEVSNLMKIIELLLNSKCLR